MKRSNRATNRTWNRHFDSDKKTLSNNSELFSPHGWQTAFGRPNSATGSNTKWHNFVPYWVQKTLKTYLCRWIVFSRIEIESTIHCTHTHTLVSNGMVRRIFVCLYGLQLQFIKRKKRKKQKWLLFQLIKKAERKILFSACVVCDIAFSGCWTQCIFMSVWVCARDSCGYWWEQME